MRNRCSWFLLAWSLLGCSASSPGSSSAASSPSSPSTPSLAPADTRPQPPVAPSAVPENATRQEPTSPARLPFAFTRVDATPVRSVAVGKPPKVAFLARGEALVFAGKGLERLPAPETGEAELSVEIFFGRDDQPRLMGFRGSGERLEPFYRRYKAGRFQPEPSELGPLAGPGGALYGVLGHADPEVVCRPRLFCLVKRVTGWSRAPAHDEPVRVVLSSGIAWALHRDRIERLERDRWVKLEPERAFHEPVSIFVDPSGSPWIVEASRDTVTRLTNGRWEAMPVPLRGPRTIWGSSATDVWLVGTGGAAHFDGKTWRLASEISGPLAHLSHSPPDLWLAGEAGIFRGTPVPSK